MKLLRQITEDVAYNKSQNDYYIEGVFMQAEIVNQNGRRYPEEVLDEATQKYIEEKVKTNRAYGELNHPSDGNPDIDLNRVSHLIVSLEKQGTNWVGKAKVFDTEKGKIVKAIIDGGGKLAVSSRALGSLKKEGGVYVVEKLKICSAADIVAEPSAPDAYVDAILEGIEWYFDEKTRQYIPMPINEVYEYKAKKIMEFIRGLKYKNK